MKHFILLSMLILFANHPQAQSDNYDTLWKEVEQQETDGLPKSALKVVEKIDALAQKEQNTAQHIKSLLYKSKYALILEDDAQLSIINDFKDEISKSETPVKNLLENMLATLYWQYFQQNRYKFYNRTNTESKVDSEDFRTWDLKTLFDEIHLHFQNSLQNGLILQQTRLVDYDALLLKADESKRYRPTLFDLINQNALAFYQTDENSITQPAYKFTIDNPNYLSDAKTFSTLNISSKDSTSLQLNALKIYQNLIAFHLKDQEPYALVDADISRLQFVNQKATFDDKQNVLLQTLKTSSDTWDKHEVSALYDFEIASIYRQQGQTYQPKTAEDSRWKLKDAVELCDLVINRFPKSKAAEKCEVLKQQILQASLQLTSETNLPIQQNALALVSYANLEQLQFKVYQLTQSQLGTLNTTYRKDEQLAFIKKLNPVTEWESSLRNEGDYQNHSTEVALPKLENGNYLIYASPNIENDSVFAYKTIQVTNLALVNSSASDQEIFQVIDRNNGNPLVGIKAKVTYQENYKDKTKTLNLISDVNGNFFVKKAKRRYYNLNIQLRSNTELASYDNFYISSYYNNDNATDDTIYNAFLFTDRSIYRPGQPLYFKGIAIKTKDGKSEVLPNETIEATLYDVNGQEVKKLTLKTNDFGSVHGEFILPNSGLTGQFYIQLQSQKKTIYANTYVSVEEYKRPKFETKFNPVTDTFKVNDSVTVKGTALAYAGSNITDAKVVYRVKRNVQYPRWYYWRRPWFSSEPQEITHGESTTNAKGEFEIHFLAIPDNGVDTTSLPVFNYEITADVTDLNGETRSATTIVNVGYHALVATIGVDENLDKTKKDNKITIDTKNLNGETVDAKGTIKIYKLVAPKTTLRPRPWSAPDYKRFTKEEFSRLFPHEAFADEHNSDTWEKGDLVFDETFDTSKSKTLALGKLKKWESGQYIIILESKDKFGQLVKDEAKTTLFSDDDTTLADHQLFSVTTDKTSYKTDENALITFGSSDAITVTVDVEKNHKVIQTYIIPLSNNKKTIVIPVTTDDVGGFAVQYSFAYNNSFQSGTETIVVPYPKTDLEIETTTFRDQLQPGTDETWSFKIKGPQGDKVSAELLASMYDASLDQFKSHRWDFSPIQQPVYRPYSNHNASKSFGVSGFRVYNNYTSVNYPNQRYDQLNWFGFYFGDGNYTRQQYLRSSNSAKSIVKTSFNKSIETGTVKGNIISTIDGLAVPGVDVIIKGTTKKTQTDFDGDFELKAKNGDVLTFSFLGYKPIEVKINSDNFFKVSLAEDNANFDEVVLSAYAIKRDKNSLGYATSEVNASVVQDLQGQVPGLNIITGNGQPGEDKAINLRGISSLTGNDEPLIIIDGIPADTNNFKSLGSNDILEVKVLKGQEAIAIYGSRGSNGVVIITTKNGQSELSQIKIRKNLQETAFFFPQLQTDDTGNVSFNFTTPEALTQWKLQLLAYTKTLESATKTLTTVTQKELMVIPNAPRFLRQGDIISISSKIANLTDNPLSGEAKLILTDAVTGKDITQDLEMLPTSETTKFTVDAKGNTQVSWTLNIPNTVDAVQYKIVAKSGNFSDGEQNVLPVLSNRILVTETLPMWIRSNETRTFTLDKLKNNSSTTLKNHRLTLEMTSNPAWYAVQALPYLMEYPYECNEQTFSRLYANALASHIANSNPRIQDVFNQWASQDVLISNLEKNEELKSILIQETPWLRDAQSETEQKKRIALLFNMNKMANELQLAKRKLKNNQMSNGAWSWFEGGRPNRYITQHIIAGFGHLKQLNVATADETDMIEKAIPYLDAEFVQEYKDLKKYDAKTDLSKDHLSYTQLQYLYMRSFFPDIEKSKEVKTISEYYQSQIQTYWLNRSLYAKGLMALVSHRNNDETTASKILKSLKENSITSDELGMYWKENTNSWYWYQAPIETQALLIEAFSEIENDTKTIDNLKNWLLKNKQTNSWKTTKATTEAVYALLLQGSDWLSVTDMVDVAIGGKHIEPSKLESVKVEAGIGYYKTSWTGSEITPKMADVTLSKKGDGIAWGSLNWQYFEDLDKITSAETPLKLSKKLFLKTNTDKGEQLSEITSETHLKVGDLVRVRIELRSDRAMEFIHMKDMRASGLEPVNVISQYKWQDGLGYYEATKDASTNFFFDYLPKGVYVFEYDLRVNNAGLMSNGITTIQSMYAPEFSSHSEGMKINVD